MRHTTLHRGTTVLNGGAVKLELRCPKTVFGVTADPEPDWSFDALISELNSLEKMINNSPLPVPFTKTRSREISNGKTVDRNASAFVMRIPDKEMDSDTESEGEELHKRSTIAVKRFNFDELYLSDSDDSDVGTALEAESYLMDEAGLVEGALLELNHEHQFGVKEEIRNVISKIETELMIENEQSTSVLARVEKYRESRRDMDKKLDTQYQRRIAEALDNHLTAVQQDHERKSQIEERKIRSDAAYEEAKRRERALQEEKLRQEKAKAEAEAKLRAEEAKRAALEAERRAAKEAAEREASENSKKTTPGVTQDLASGHQTASSDAQSKGTVATNKSQSAGDNIVRAAENALNLEQQRLQKLKECEEQNQSIISRTKQDFGSLERHVSRLIGQIRGTRDNVRTKASELIKILNSASCPQSISIATFAKKVFSHYENPDKPVFACGHVIVMVTSQFPLAMDILLGEFHRACIYTVPKHIAYSKSAFGTKEAYYKAIGYREIDGKLESHDDFLRRLRSYIRLYAAMIQTEVQGIQNAHGLKEGWAWLARFLNTLPANIYTAVALCAFLQTAGFALFRRYKSQFMKLLSIISNNFLNELKRREDPKFKPIIAEIQSYIDDKKCLQEPEGRTIQASPLLSSTMVPDSDYQDSYNRYQYQQYYR